MKANTTAVALCLIAALLILLAWLTVTGRIGKSRHGYASARTLTMLA